jgi:AdoMet-dependent heme synthase
LADAGCFFLTFTGGEALLHPNLEKFICRARKRRLLVRLKSNGVLLTQPKLAMLVDAGLGAVDVSLYGACAPTHDAITASPGSFEKTIAGIRRAKEAGLMVKVNICVMRENAPEFDELLALVRGLDVHFGIDPFMTARYDGTTSSLDRLVDRSTLKAMYEGPLKPLMREPDFDPNRSVQCGCARASCGISATGEVYPCIGAPIPSGNLREQRFAQIWHESPQLNAIRKLGLQDFVTCRSCPDRAFCGRNSGVVYNNTGYYTGPEPFTCMDASVVHEIYLER